MISNANRYGLVKGNAQSDLLELTPDGLKAVDLEIPHESGKSPHKACDRRDRYLFKIAHALHGKSSAC
jgi:hypothetical protein